MDSFASLLMMMRSKLRLRPPVAGSKRRSSLRLLYSGFLLQFGTMPRASLSVHWMIAVWIWCSRAKVPA